jgi:hypothetical protein
MAQSLYKMSFNFPIYGLLAAQAARLTLTRAGVRIMTCVLSRAAVSLYDAFFASDTWRAARATR